MTDSIWNFHIKYRCLVKNKSSSFPNITNLFSTLKIVLYKTAVLDTGEKNKPNMPIQNLDQVL